jgi:molecular chaperone DnaK
MGKVVGIDLGTTNSVVAVMEGGKPTVIANAEGLRTTASIVAYTKKQEILVGQIAKRQAVINPENTFFSVKRFIGSKIQEISESSRILPYKIKEDNNKNVRIMCPNLNKEFSPEEISAQILKKLVNDASKYLGETVTQAVITVPAYFNDSQRKATKDAGKIAGIEVLRIINEPTAASLAYGLDNKNNETVLVFDLGGGTFDVSILEVGDGIFEVLSTSGDTNLGGDNFDKVIVDWLVKNFQDEYAINLAENSEALQRLIEAAEKAKIELSNVMETTISLRFIDTQNPVPTHIEETLTRAKFEQLCSDLIDKCRIPVEIAIKEAKINASKIDEVVLVGGSTRIPAIQELVKKLTGKKPNQTVNPDEVVAMGAAIQGGILAGEVTDVLLLDVTPLSLGIQTLGDVMTKIITRNTTIPTTKYEVFSTSVDNQTSVDIQVLQGERLMASDNKSLGNFSFGDIPPALRSVPLIQVTFDIDVNGILSVCAKDQTSGKEQSMTIKNSASTLGESEIEKMITDAERFAEIDKEKREQNEVKNSADLLCYQAAKEIQRPAPNPLKENEKVELKAIETEATGYIEEILKNIKEEKINLIQDKTEKLQNLVTKMGNLKN